MTALRREFHQYPEISGQEKKTAVRVAEVLDGMGLHVATGIGGENGVVGFLEGSSRTPCIAIRADMDALPVPEATGLPFSSHHEGVSHACGHDAHMAMALGAARVLSDWPSGPLNGSVKFVFQPAEENLGGARTMVSAGVLDNPLVDAVLALHMDGSRPVGTITFREGQQSAATCELTLVLKGAGGHAAYPHRGCDTIHMACEVVTSLQSWLSRVRAPSEPLVLTWGMMSGGWKSNVMAETVELQGTLRTTGFERTDEVVAGSREIMQGIVGPRGGSFELSERKGYPPVHNDRELGVEAKKICGFLDLPYQNLEYPTMGGEDFSYFAAAVPGLLAFIGCCGDDEILQIPHSSTFCLDERVLSCGTGYLVAMALHLLP